MRVGEIFLLCIFKILNVGRINGKEIKFFHVFLSSYKIRGDIYIALTLVHITVTV